MQRRPHTVEVTEVQQQRNLRRHLCERRLQSRTVRRCQAAENPHHVGPTGDVLHRQAQPKVAVQALQDPDAALILQQLDGQQVDLPNEARPRALRVAEPELKGVELPRSLAVPAMDRHPVEADALGGRLLVDAQRRDLLREAGEALTRHGLRVHPSFGLARRATTLHPVPVGDLHLVTAPIPEVGLEGDERDPGLVRCVLDGEADLWVERRQEEHPGGKLSALLLRWRGHAQGGEHRRRAMVVRRVDAERDGAALGHHVAPLPE